MAMGCQQCLLLSIVQMEGKYCRKPHCHLGIVCYLLLQLNTLKKLRFFYENYFLNKSNSFLILTYYLGN